MTAERSDTGLQADALGLLATAALTAAYMAPALSIYALFGLIANQAGASVGFVMLVAVVLAFLFGSAARAGRGHRRPQRAGLVAV